MNIWMNLFFFFFAFPESIYPHHFHFQLLFKVFLLFILGCVGSLLQHTALLRTAAASWQQVKATQRVVLGPPTAVARLAAERGSRVPGLQ